MTARLGFRKQIRSPPSNGLKLVAVGDLAFSGGVPHDGLASLAAEFQEAGLVFANYEGVVSDLPHANRQFSAPPAAASVVGESGIRLVNLANNHILDYGVDGLEQTRCSLNRAEIVTVGLEPQPGESPLAVTYSDVLSVGWLAMARTGQRQLAVGPRFRELHEGALLAEVAVARREVDVVVVSLHLGYMYVDYPHPEHRSLALQLADAGAHLILMHHAHVLQGVEVTPGGTVICYSLGNLLVDPEEGQLSFPVVPELQRQGALFRFEIDRQGVAGFEVIPTVIGDDLRVRLAEGEEARAIIGRLERISRELEGDEWVVEFERQRAERNADLGLAELRALLLSGRWLALVRMLRRGRVEHLRMLWRRLVSQRPAASA